MHAIERSPCWHYRLQKRFFHNDADPNNIGEYLWRFLQILAVILAFVIYIVTILFCVASISYFWARKEIFFTIMGYMFLIFFVGTLFTLILPFIIKGIIGIKKWQTIIKPIRSIKEKVWGDKIVYH